MRKSGSAILFCSILLVAGCNSSDLPSAALQELAQCTAFELNGALGPVFEGILQAFLATPTPGSPPAGIIIVDNGNGSFNYTVNLDLDENSVNESSVIGIITFSGNAANGIQVGESGSATWNLAGAIATGNGGFVTTLETLTTARVTGSGSILDVTGCQLDIDAMNLVVNALNPDLLPVGTIDFTTTVNGGADTMSGTITFDGTQLAAVSAGILDFTIDLETGDVTF